MATPELRSYWYGCVWKCCVPLFTQWFCWSLSIIIPFLNGYKSLGVWTPFSDIPICKCKWWSTDMFYIPTTGWFWGIPWLVSRDWWLRSYSYNGSFTLWWTFILPWKDPPFLMGKSHYFYGHVQLLFVCSPEGMIIPKGSAYLFFTACFSMFLRLASLQPTASLKPPL